jgi:photosystem II stability/assembly factor-like uncharacterized protein
MKKPPLLKYLFGIILVSLQVGAIYFTLNWLLPKTTQPPFALLTRPGSEETAPPEYEKVLTTIDGGLHWTSVYSTTSSLNNLNCPSTRRCFSLKADETVLATSDGGNTWVEKPLGVADSQYLFALTCPGIMSCYTLAESSKDAAIFSTVDGGQSWLKPYTTTGKNPFRFLSCPASGEVCYGVESKGKVLATSDGGRNWKTQNAELKKDFNSLRCFETDYCLGSTSDGTILVTKNGGISWSEYSITEKNTLYLRQISCPQAESCFALGQSRPEFTPKLFKTIDGGQSWRPLIFEEKGYFTTLSCPSTTTCFLAGENGQIKVTTDGGQSWQSQKTGVAQELFNLICPDARTCFVLTVLYDD